MRAQVEVVEDAERDQRHDTLAVGRDLVQSVAAIVHLERLHPVRPVRLQIGRAQRAALLLRRRLELFSKFAAIERLSLRGSDLFKGQCVFLENKFFARARRTSFRHKGLRKTRLVLQLIDLGLPLPRDGRRDEKTLAAVADRLLEEFSKRQLAELAVKLDPRRYCSWHGHRIPAALRYRRLAAEVIGRPRTRRASRGVQAVELSPVPDEYIAIRTDPFRTRPAKGRRERGGENRAPRVAAGGEHLQPRLRGERLGSGDDVLREQRLARPSVRVPPRKGSHRTVKVLIHPSCLL